ncbi:[acyl-carrier-protein] S-malonyltransferase [Vulcanibacillus modesticaldus]|uniref:Malonyl CoA-acyl carrier protein transacylase n=2 Tax=Vulcanibacillus modesticaldus TaxID=337097 RepID=A0A1D2YY25_9BACI|nr:[acyl-carrier-protein] S-malonyltransferase [Vulcanibacillus modesticaldus]
MGMDFYQEYSTARVIFDAADDILGYPLSKLMFEGPEDELRLTRHTQPAILTNSIAIWNVIKEKITISPAYMAGHSLGEYSALTAAGGISFEDALELVKNRGQFMEEAVAKGEGTMAAIMGIGRNELETICYQVTNDGYSVQLANMNTPNQIVISGTVKGVEFASKLAKEGGARRVIPLSVSGPFHSRLMQPAKERLRPLVDQTLINKITIPLVMNVNAKPESNPSSIKENLIEQVVSPVLWTDMVEWMIENGVDTFIEVGPGKVLAGLIKKINRNVKTFSIENVQSFKSFIEELEVKGGE